MNVFGLVFAFVSQPSLFGNADTEKCWCSLVLRPLLEGKPLAGFTQQPVLSEELGR